MPLNPEISLVGSGGHARVVASSARRWGLTVGAVSGKDPDLVGRAFAGVIVETDFGRIDAPLHIAIGSNPVRRAVAQARTGARWACVVAPAATVANDVAVGEGALIGLGACIQTGASIGRHAIVNTGAIVEHDCVVGDFAHVAPGAVLTGKTVAGSPARFVERGPK